MSPQVTAILPEILVTGAACLLLLARPGRMIASLVAALALAIAIPLLPVCGLPAQSAWGETWFTGPVPVFLKALMLSAGLVGLALLHGDSKVRHHYAEAVALLLLTLVGGMLLVSARHLALAYVAFELISVPSYALAGFARDDARSAEGGLKYAVFGGAASALMLYGFSLLFGLTGSLEYSGIVSGIGNVNTSGGQLVLAAAALLVFAGAMYKLAAAPFHYWCPDAFEGAPTSIAAFLSIAPKIAGFGFLLQLTTMLDAHPAWGRLLAASAFLSMVYGNLVAVPQQNIKRLLAYSSIAHAGYLLTAASLNSVSGDFAVLFYLATYLLMNLGAFYIAGTIAPQAVVADFRGLGARAPVLAAYMAVFLFSLTGLPPFAGFIGKFFILDAAIGQRAWILIVTLILASVVSLFYYARILRAMYFETATAETPLPRLSALDALAIGLLAVTTLVLGLAWGPLGELLKQTLGA